MKFSNFALPILSLLATSISAAREVQLFALSSSFLDDDLFLTPLVALHSAAGTSYLMTSDENTGFNQTVFNYHESNNTLTMSVPVTFGEGDVRTLEWPVVVMQNQAYGDTPAGFPYLAVSVAGGDESRWNIDDKGFLSLADSGSNVWLAQNTSDPYGYTNNDFWAVGVSNETSTDSWSGSVQKLTSGAVYVRDVYHFP